MRATTGTLDQQVRPDLGDQAALGPRSTRTGLVPSSPPNELADLQKAVSGGGGEHEGAAFPPIPHQPEPGQVVLSTFYHNYTQPTPPSPQF